ncbi:hypothetical protein RC54_12490 [Herbaspirillum rubrisubalbicans]|uniref:Uncharacterized protein n=2 Tax=Herbaspirillum rubrisubalbicans TaxID=80842 RepID=A0AAD0U8C7_9BURK|nr:hypothetical protein RC54_12490 [Herbaspirillum rubrisubalbicans]
MLVHQGRRVIVDEIEAHDIMSHVYSLNASQMVQAARSHHEMMAGNSPQEERSVIRGFADLIYRAGNMDPNTRMQSRLTDLTNNADLKNREYTAGGGFTAFEKMTPLPPTRKKPEGDLIPGQRNIEFHPPGGLHNPGKYTNLHGSYLRPATQPNQKKALERSFSSGALTHFKHE